MTIVLAVATVVAVLSKIPSDRRRRVLTWSRSESSPSGSPPANSVEPVPADSANVASTTAPAPSATPVSPGNDTLKTIPDPLIVPGGLMVPVSGVRPDQLRDTFSEARSDGRVHDAIDIPAPRGTAVLATADGTILKLFQSERGGTTIYQLSADGKFIYYYAHLERYAAGLVEGHVAKRGETIAYVGDTGNAGTGNYHLHFSVAVISDPKRYWEGVNINPYPLLKK